MKKNVLRVLALVLTVAIAFTVVHFAVLGDNTPVDTTFTFALENDEAIITGASDALSGAVVLPATLSSCPVVGIAENAFEDCTNVTAFFLPDSIRTIGNYAFENCTALRQMILPAGITSIGDGAFWNCKKLLSVTVPAACEAVGSCAFYGCDALESVIVPGTTTQTAGMFNVALDIGQYMAINNPARQALDPVHTTVYCYNGSVAHSAAQKDGYCTYQLLDDCVTTSYTVRFVNEAEESVATDITVAYQPVGIRVAAVAEPVNDETVLAPDTTVQTLVLAEDNNLITFIYPDVPETTTIATTTETTTEEPTTEESTTEEQTTVEPTTEEPTTVEPTTEEPTTAEPTTAEPTTVEPTTEEPYVAPSLTAKEGSGAVIDKVNGYIYGIDLGLTQEQLVSRYLQIEGKAHIEVSDPSNLSTGCVVNFVRDSDLQVLESYTIIIFGDLNGDGYFTSTDLSMLKSFFIGTMDEASAPIAYFACDLDNDGYITSTDRSFLVGIIATTIQYDQALRSAV